MDSRDDRDQRQGVHGHARREHGDWSPPTDDDDIMRGVFPTMRSRDHDVVLVRRTINLGYWEFGMGRG
jgi:uncharacterized protein (DUF849 family)